MGDGKYLVAVPGSCPGRTVLFAASCETGTTPYAVLSLVDAAVAGLTTLTTVSEVAAQA